MFNGKNTLKGPFSIVMLVIPRWYVVGKLLVAPFLAPYFIGNKFIPIAPNRSLPPNSPLDSSHGIRYVWKCWEKHGKTSLLGGWATPLKNMGSSIGMVIPNIWKNKKCSKPPTRSNLPVDRSTSQDTSPAPQLTVLGQEAAVITYGFLRWELL